MRSLELSRLCLQCRPDEDLGEWPDDRIWEELQARLGLPGFEGPIRDALDGLMELSRQGRFPYERLITEFPLAEVNEALEASHRGDVLKPVLRMPE